ncbi:helix-turn-helix domain-containing protein [Sphingopyxis fribergensis]
MDVRLLFGKNVKTLRKAAGYTQDEFADLARVARSYMSGIENGKRAPSIVVVEKIADALAVPISRMFE